MKKKAEYIARYGEEAYKKQLEKNRERNRKNKEKLAEYHKNYYKKNKEKLAEQQKEYQQNNKEKIAEKGKEYRKNNKEKIAERDKKYREQNKEKIAKRKKDYQLRKYVENGNIEAIENYQLANTDNFIGWQCHHRLETHNSDGIRRTVNLSRNELIALNMYYDRPAQELVFMKTAEHIALHKQKVL